MKLLVCGKGGSGKSTLSAFLAMTFAKNGRQVLLVDADESNIGLYRMLGVDMPESLMDYLGGKKGFQEKRKSSGMAIGGGPSIFPTPMPLDRLPAECVAVTDAIRIMSVGKIHHFNEGCACPMGQLFKMVFSSLKLEDEDVVIVDAAAGIEHFGRGLDQHCDHALCVVDPSFESLSIAGKASALAEQAGIGLSIILNKITPETETELTNALSGQTIIGHMPNSNSIFMSNLKGQALNLDADTLGQMKAIVKRLLETL